MNKIAIAAFTAALSISSLNLANADQRGLDWMPAELVTQTIIQLGYTEITKLKADGGEWEGEGVAISKANILSTQENVKRHYSLKCADDADARLKAARFLTT